MDEYEDEKFEEYEDDFEDEPEAGDNDDDEGNDMDEGKQDQHRRFASADVAAKMLAPQKADEPRRELTAKERELEALQKSIDMENALAKERARAQAQSQAAQQERKYEEEKQQWSEGKHGDERKTAALAPPRQNMHAHRRRMRRLEAVKRVVALREEKFVLYRSRRGSRYDAYKARLNAAKPAIRQQAAGRDEERDMGIQTESFTSCDHAVQFKYGDDTEFYKRVKEIQQQQRRQEQQATGTGLSEGEIQRMMHQVNTTTLTPFVMAAGKIMQLVLEDQESAMSDSARADQHGTTSNDIFDNTSTWQALGTDISQGANMLLQGRKIRAVAFAQLQPRLLSTWHQALDNAEEDLLPRQLVGAIWDMTDPQAPIEILAAAGAPTSATFSATESHIIAAATDDGSLHIWDLREPRGLHLDADALELNVRCGIRRPTYSTNGFSLERCVHVGRIESIISIGTANRSNGLDHVQLRSGSSQFAALDEHGVLSFWMTTTASEKHQDDVALNIGGRVRLISTKVLELESSPAAPGDSFLHAGGLASCYRAVAVSHAQPDTFLVGSHGGAVLKTSRFATPKPPTVFGRLAEAEDGGPAISPATRVVCMAVCPHDERLFLTAKDCGSLELWELSSSTPKLSWSLAASSNSKNKASWRPVHVHWRHEVQGAFVVILQSGTTLEFDLFASLDRPTTITQATTGPVRTCDISPCAFRNIYCAISNGKAVSVRKMNVRQGKGEAVRAFETLADLLGL